MKKEEAIEILEDLYGYFSDNQGRDYDEAFRMAIEALKAEGAQGVGRYENAMQKLREMPKYFNGVKAKQIKKISDDAVQGEWIKTVDGNGWNEWYVFKCPLCGATIEDKQYRSWEYNFCPNCGVHMRGEVK